MKKLLVVFMLTLAGCGGCSARLKPQADVLSGIPQERDPSLAVSTKTLVIGHACPVDGYVLTARHVVFDETLREYQDVAWSDGYGNEGFAFVAQAHPALDVAALTIYEGNLPPVYLKSGDVQVGEKVFWFEYDFRSLKNLMRARRRWAYVLREVTHHYVLDAAPVSGASGTCLLNSKGEVVGLINAGWEAEDGREAGFASKLPPLPEIP